MVLSPQQRALLPQPAQAPAAPAQRMPPNAAQARRNLQAMALQRMGRR